MKRRLAAILAADVAGYSALMSTDQENTLAALRQLRAEVFGPVVAGHRGKVVKSMGDGWLVEFASAVDAATCAMQIQDRLSGHATIRLRIGIHIGDVVHEDEDVFGDGVNVAARLEGIAEPGTVVVSDAVYGALDGTLRPSFDDQGRQNLKNIDRPVRVWVRGGGLARSDGGAQPGGADFSSLAIVPITTSDTREDVRELAAALTSDLSGYLSAAEWLDVVTTGAPPESAFVLDAALRSRAERLRLDVRLAAPDGALLWSGKYDGLLADSFDWQDETGEDVAAETLGRVLDLERQRLARKSIAEMTAEECHLYGNLCIALVDRASMRAALDHQSAAIEKKPGYARALCVAIANYHASKTMGLTDITADFADRFQDWLAAAEPMTATDPVLELYVAIATRTPDGDQTRLRRAVQGALRQAPFLPDVVLFCAAAHVWMGDPEPALECLRTGRKLHRLSPWAAAQTGFRALACVMAGRDDEAVAIAEEGLRLTGGFATLQRALASAHANAGRMDEARAALAQVMALLPDETIAFGRERSGYSDTPGTRRYFDGLRRAGMPEGEG